MSAFLVIPFLVAFIVGGRAAWRLPQDDAPAFAILLFILSSAVVAGAISVAAEAGSAMARYLGLLSVLLASAALSGAFFTARRTDWSRRRTERP